jgi:hypothetical protein
MNKLENKLKNIKMRELSDEEKNSIWNSVLLNHINLGRETADSFSYISIFNLHIKKFAFASMMLFFVVFAGGAGMISASEKAGPGSNLFMLNLAVENFQIKVAAPEEKDKLRLKFAEERVIEVKALSLAKSTTVLVRAIEDGAESEVSTIKFSKKENAGVEVALNNLTKLVEDSSDKTNAEKIEKAQEELLVILGDEANLVVKRANGVITVGDSESEEILVKEDEDKSEEIVEEVSKDEVVQESVLVDAEKEIPDVIVVDEVVNSEPATLLKIENEFEIENAEPAHVAPIEEVFCRGEWRVVEECELKDEEVKGITDEVIVVDEKTELEIKEDQILLEVKAKIQGERAVKCTESGGSYDLSNDECLGVSGAMCTDIGGAWNECASACRNNPEAVVCTMQCVQICEFN